MDLTSAEERVLRAISDMNLAKKSDIERMVSNENIQNVDIDEFITSAVEGLMRKNLVTKIHPIGVACYIITRQGNSTLMFMDNGGK